MATITGKPARSNPGPVERAINARLDDSELSLAVHGARAIHPDGPPEGFDLDFYLFARGHDHP